MSDYEDDHGQTATKSGTYTTEKWENLQDSFNTILLRLDPTPTLNEIRRFLMRQTKYNTQTQRWETPKGSKPMMAEQGIDELLLELRIRMGVDKVLGKLTDERIKMIVNGCGEVILEFIFFNNEKYDIDEGDYLKIFWNVVHNVDMFIRRSINGTENELITKSFAQRELITKHDEGTNRPLNTQQKNGFFNRFGR